MLERATGWLGWTPEVALRSSIFHIEMAMAGKIDFLKATNPWGGGEGDDRTRPPEDVVEDDDEGSQLAAMLRGMSCFAKD